MLPELKSDQNVYIEITNKVHGGLGWDFSSCLWSPVYDRGRAKAWKIMEKVNVGDIILHLLKEKDGYHWAGVSVVEAPLYHLDTIPPIPDRWDEPPYQRIDVTQFTAIEPSIHIKEFFRKYENILNNIYENRENGLFFNKYGGNEFRINQTYLVKAEPNIYNLFNDFSNYISFDYSTYTEHKHIATDNEPTHSDYDSPGSVETTVYRKIRDTQLVREVKSDYNWRCQICGKRILLPNGNYYAEGHHLKPLGGGHEGPDVRGNIIILCPYHHAEFDYKSIAIDPDTNLICHIDQDNRYNGNELYYGRDDLNMDFIRYHFDEIFRN